MSELVRVTQDHALNVLAPRAISPEAASRLGVYSVTKPEELPDELKGNKYAIGTGLVFPWRSPTGEVVPQFRPDNPQPNPHGDPVKYVFPGGQRMVLNQLRPESSSAADGPILLVEGTCQSIAASIYAPLGWQVFGLSGCWNWRLGDTTVAIPDLMVVEDRQVVVCLDADAATNRNVYDAGIELAKALEAEGADGVTFARLAGAGKKAGLDDVLGIRPEEKRRSYVLRLIEKAASRPADKPPAVSRSGVKASLTAKDASDRPLVVVTEDRLDVIRQLVDGLASKWAGTELFCFGNVLAKRTGNRLEPVHKDMFGNLVTEANECVNAKGDHVWPDAQTMGSALAKADRFPVLERISEVPFVRADGTICQTSGYDEASRTYLVLDESAEAIVVPEYPTDEEVSEAVKLLTVEWLGDLMAIMPEESDKANCLALFLTPLIRGMVPLAPLAVIDGLQMGVGKNLIADVLSIFATGKLASPLPYSADDDENRKVITSTFRSGAELFVFDEAHQIQGAQLARSITSSTYTDRVLGVSTMAEFPNKVTWVALGNNVSINGDLARRVYRIRLAPGMANPQDRSADSFRHPDLKEWTRENRADLLAAGLTIIRAWMAGERQESAAGRKFGSFERWGGIVGGILESAGIVGLLDNLATWRSESDFDTAYWTEHLHWLDAKFGTDEFTVADVVHKMNTSRAGSVEHPPRLDDHTVTGYNRQLGQAYGRVRGRSFGGLTLTKVLTTSHGSKWRIVTDSDAGQDAESRDLGPDLDPSGDGSDRSDTSVPASSRTSKRVIRITPSTHEGAAGGMYPIYPNYQADGGQAAVALLSLAGPENVAPARECPDCDAPEELVPGTHWYACRSCTPSTFL